MLQEHVQGFRQPTELTNLLTMAEILELDRVTNRPFYIISKISKEIRHIKDCIGFTPREKQSMMKYVDELCACIGSSERIVQTPGMIILQTSENLNCTYICSN